MAKMVSDVGHGLGGASELTPALFPTSLEITAHRGVQVTRRLEIERSPRRGLFRLNSLIRS